MSNDRRISSLKLLSDSRNWGDKIALYLYRRITGKSPRVIHATERANEAHFLTVGSVLRMADGMSVIWGTGFLTPSDALGSRNWGRDNSEVHCQPLKLCAVRGPLTHSKLERMGLRCPRVFGDPALLMAKFHRTSGNKKYKLGVIPHFKDRTSTVVRRLSREDGVLLINPVFSRFSLTSWSKYLRFLDQIQSCEYVASSSLHGLIMADAYGIPARWCVTSSDAWESDFKFYDYFGSVGRPDVPPFIIDDKQKVPHILKAFHPYNARDCSEGLLNACPFT